MSKQAFDAIFLLDKPVGRTSNEVLQEVKRMLGSKKAGHTGSLDPIASGLLPICLGGATRFSQFLLESTKSYVVTGKLGENTLSGDCETKVIKQRETTDVSYEKIKVALEKFKGKINQIPPMYSAIKYQGKPLYKLARQGIEVTRQPREITIYKLELISFADDLLTLEITCTKGTYIRTLIDDLGEVLGCGAHVVELRRTAVGPYREHQMVSLDQLAGFLVDKKTIVAEAESWLLPIESMFSELPRLELSTEMLSYLLQGSALFVPKLISSESLVSVYDKSGTFCGIGEATAQGKLIPRKLLDKRQLIS